MGTQKDIIGNSSKNQNESKTQRLSLNLLKGPLIPLMGTNLSFRSKNLNRYLFANIHCNAPHNKGQTQLNYPFISKQDVAPTQNII